MSYIANFTNYKLLIVNLNILHVYIQTLAGKG